MEQSRSWRQLLSTRTVTHHGDLLRSLPNNRRVRADGLRMISVFDEHGTDEAARRLLEREPDDAYLFGYAPLQMRLINGDTVWLPGPKQPLSILRLTSGRAVGAAMRYWHAVLETCYPCRMDPATDEALTHRQRCILDLLLQDKTDEEVSRILQVSVRTVRGDVAAMMAATGCPLAGCLGLRLCAGDAAGA